MPVIKCRRCQGTTHEPRMRFRACKLCHGNGKQIVKASSEDPVARTARWARYKKTNLITKAYHSDRMKAPKNINLFAALGAEWPTVSLTDALTNATEEQLNAALALCEE